MFSFYSSILSILDQRKIRKIDHLQNFRSTHILLDKGYKVHRKMVFCSRAQEFSASLGTLSYGCGRGGGGLSRLHSVLAADLVISIE